MIINKKQFTKLGCYFTDTFVIQLNDKYDLNKLNTDLLVRGTFFHEYTHFLQNILTPNGNTDILTFFTLIDTVFKLNFYNKVNGAKDNIDKITDYLNYYNDYDDETDYNSDNDKFLEIDENYNFKFKSATTGEIKSIKLGSIHVDEGMAFLIEYIMIGPNRELSPENPYNLLTEYAENEVPYLKNDKIKLLALYEKSLHFFDSAKYFIDAIKYIKKEISENLTLIDFENKLDSFSVQYLKANYFFTEFDTLSKAIFKGKGLEKTKIWFDDLCNKAKDFINKHSYPITFIFNDIYEKALKGETIDLTNIFYNYIGCPLIYWKKEVYTLNGSDVNKNIIAIKIMVDLAVAMINNEKYSCSNYDNCDNKKDYCITNIYDCLKEENLCPLGMILKTFGLKDKIISI